MKRKLKMMNINCKGNKINLTVNNKDIEVVKEYKYLGDYFNEKGNNDSLIDNRIKNVYMKLLTIKAICKELYLGQYDIVVRIKLYESIFISSLLHNCQSWTNLRKSSDIRKMLTLQTKYLKQMLHVPYSCANIGIFLELGILPVNYLIDIRRITFLHHIYNLPNDDPVQQLHYQQQKFEYESNWSNEIKNKLLLYGI